jgi:hypothetical protein
VQTAAERRQPPPAPAWRARLGPFAGRAAVLAVAAAGLFTLYYLQSRTVPLASDGATLSLQAWDMLHGNVLLHGWTMSDVSFWATELPEYAMIEAVRGLGPGVVHIGGALTYTILVLLAGWLAMGRGPGGRVRFGLASGLMLSPALGAATSTLLLTADHLGSAVPVLLAWLLADRAPRRWYVPAGIGLLLAWGQVGDPLILVTGAAPFLLVYGTLAVRGRERFAAAVAAAALVSYPAAKCAEALIRLAGGYALQPVATQLPSASRLPHNALLAVQGIAELFGASFYGPRASGPAGFAVLHVAGLALFAVALVVAVAGWRRGDDLVTRGLMVAMACNTAAYILSTYPQNRLSTRAISAVLPFGAVVTARVLAGPLARLRLLPVLAVFGAGYLAALCYGASRPPAPSVSPLAAWLSARGLTHGLGAGYWLANITTVDTGGRVTVREVSIMPSGASVPSGWGHESAWYAPPAAADFLVLSGHPDASRLRLLTRQFGEPARELTAGQDTVLVWRENLLPYLQGR